MIDINKLTEDKNKPKKAYFGELSAQDLYEEMRKEGSLPSQQPGFLPLVDMPEGPAKDARRKEILSKLL